MAISRAQVIYGIIASASGTRQGVKWNPKLGLAAASLEFPDANIFHYFSATLESVSDGITYNTVFGLSSDADAGATVIAGGDGKDFEGRDQEDIAILNAILLRCTAGGFTATRGGVETANCYAGETRLLFSTGSALTYLGDIVFTAVSDDTAFELFVIGSPVTP